MYRYALFAALLTACGGDDTTLAVEHYAAGVEASYAASIEGAEALDASLEALVAMPTEGALTSAQDAWRASRVPYLQTEVFRFYDGPIDDEDGPEGLLNAWPMDENFVDYVEGQPDSGIINGTDPIDSAFLVSQNESGGEKNIATGYHAIEFLLWGQDLSDVTAGQRPFTDYVPDGGSAANEDRRGQYLTVTGDLLVDNLDSVAAEWAPDGAYRMSFEDDAEASFGKILTGMIILSGFETGGERLQAALDSGDREDEHSCFSDNTKVDMVEDVRGVQNVWLGRYGSLTGTGIVDVVTEADVDLAAQVTDQIETSLELAEALVDPFENEIAPGNAEGRARVQALIDSLRAQEGLLEDVFRAFDLDIPVAE